MKNQKTMGNKGFSLVELIVVIAIMAVLIGVLAPQFIKYVENSRQSTDLQNIQQMKTAIETYASDNEDCADVTITVKGTACTVTGETDAVTEAGLSTSITLKSNGWPSDKDYVYTYDTDTYTWDTDSCENGKGKKLNIQSVFE